MTLPPRLAAFAALLAVAATPALAQSDGGPVDPRLAAMEQAAADGGADAPTARALARAALATVSEDQKLFPGNPRVLPEPTYYDNYGYSVAVSGTTAVVGAHQDNEYGSFSGAAYVLELSGGVWIQVAKLRAFDAAPGDRFGTSVAVSGTTAVVGAHQDDDDGFDSGSAYVFERSGGAWTQVWKLAAYDAADYDNFGASVAVSGGWVVVGASGDDDDGSVSGSAYAFDLSYCAAQCTETSKLTASDAASGDSFGISVAVSGTTAVVGATGDDDGGSESGSAYAFDLSGCVWRCTETSKLSASDAASGDRFGWSVAVSGTTAVVGAYFNDDGGSDSGSAYVFDLSGCGTVCTESSKLTASDAAAGDWFGVSVAVSGTTAVVGAFFNDDGGSASGSAYAFDLSGCGAVCTETSKLTASDAASGDTFGYAVAVSGSTAVVGAYGDNDGGTDSGSAYVFELSACGAACTETSKLSQAPARARNDTFGFSVAVSGSTAVIGAHQDDGDRTDSGSAYVFERSGGAWAQVAKLTASDAAAGDLFGASVAVSGTTAVVGAYLDDDGGTYSGSAYVFERSGGAWAQVAKLTASDAASLERFGWSVAVSGTTAVVGAYGDDDGGTDSGSAYVFELSGCGAACTETAKLTASDAASGDRSGRSVAVSGMTAVVGAYLDDDAGLDDAGSAYAFILPGSPLAQVTLDGAEGWRMPASPEATTLGAFLGDLWTQGYTGSDNSDGECTVFTFAESAANFDAGWTCATNATDALAPGQGLIVYVFEDDDPRPSAPGIQNPFPKTLSSSVAVAPTGDFTFAPAFTDDTRPLAQKGWNLFGSPFGSSLDWDGVTRSGVTQTIYVYDPAFAGGGYRTYTSENGVGNGDLPGGVVPPFQGFFAKAYAPSPSLVMPQTGGTADGQDVYGRFALGEPPLPPSAPLQSLSVATASDDHARLVTTLGTISPNPTRGTATVSWTLAEAGDVRVSVVDLLGREVAVIAEGALAAGPQRSDVPSDLAPGVYVVRLTAGATSQAARFTVVR